ncbi:nucleotidyltransferase family protein [uncultured Microbulbifer sp.]|uniref:nucleotidyltransferase family protein n=1 Tax=uncultured Microbulbifer sp. TaxID=348147 RepID=UPI0026131A6A|nr:nucleotidyltransferase family protein [uncultured Microbulbifer sp.]
MIDELDNTPTDLVNIKAKSASAKTVLVAVLAGGASQRFKGCKLAADIDVFDASGKVKRQPLILHSLDKVQCLIAKAPTKINYQVMVVLGEHSQVITALLPDEVMVIKNQQWQQGISSSIKVAVAKAQSIQADGLLITLADHIGVALNDLYKLTTTWFANGQTSCAQYKNSFGTPAIFNSEDFKILLSLSGDKGAKKLLIEKEKSQQINVIDIKFVTTDIDSKTDLEKWQQQMKVTRNY